MLTEWIYVIMAVLFGLVFVIALVFMLVMLLRSIRAPRAYYYPRPTAGEIIGQLMCPKCGSKDLETLGYYSLRCRGCGFVFSIGIERPYGFFLWPWFFPFFWSVFWWGFLRRVFA